MVAHADDVGGISVGQAEPGELHGVAGEALTGGALPFAKKGGWTKETLEKRLLRKVAKASEDFGLIEPNDHIMVCVSGGKDSYTMLHLLREVRRHTPFPFTMIAVNLDQKQPNFPTDVIPRYMVENGYDFKVVERDTYSVVTEKIPEGKTYCSLCSRLRRGILYDTAVSLGATKIALGHHRDDAIETLLLNLLYSGQMKAMPPKLRSDDGRNIVIRPSSTATRRRSVRSPSSCASRSSRAICAVRRMGCIATR